MATRDKRPRLVTDEGRRTKDEGRKMAGEGRKIKMTGDGRPATALNTPHSALRTSSAPIDVHRLVASLALVLLMLATLFVPLSYAAPNPAPFFTPRIDGSGSVETGFTASELESAVFPYQTYIERNSQGNLSSTWPSMQAVLNFEPASLEARRAIIGQMFGSTGGLNVRMRDTGLASNPAPELLSAIELTYQQMTSDETRQNFGINGLGLVAMVRSLTAPTLEDRYNNERDAILVFQRAASADAQTWQFTYNWALANFLVGNYTAAYQGLRSIVINNQAPDYKFVQVWMGIAAMRAGEPDDAVNLLKSVTDFQLPTGAAENVVNYFNEANGVAQEALGDAQWARRDPATAYKTYLDMLKSGGSNVNVGLYRKWLRLGLEQRGYEKMLGDMAAIANSGVAVDLKARIHHDRARLLSLLGRGAEAMAEYKLALDLGQNDQPLLVSYGEALASQGDYNGAIVKAEEALRSLDKDVSAGDMEAVASAVVTTTSTFAERATGQATLDAHLLRARAWSRQGDLGKVDTLAGNITSGAAQMPANVGGLLLLYGGYAYEAAAGETDGDTAAGLYGKAAEQYGKAWDRLKSLAPGVAGRAAALAGQARTIALSKGKTAQDGVAALKAGGYDPVAISTKVASDLDAPDVLYQGARLLEHAGQQKEAANAYRVAGVVRNLRDAQSYSGIGRPLWANNGTAAPATAALKTGDAARLDAAAGGDPGLAVMRYKQAFSLDPALAPAWNNLGVYYAQLGNPASKDYLTLAAKASPNYALGNHNLAGAAYKDGIGNFFTAEGAQGEAIKSAGARSLNWGYDLRYDERGPIPAPPGPSTDFLARLPALVILALLLAHTLVGHDRMTNRMGLIPTKGVIGWLATRIDARVKAVMPELASPSAGSRALLVAIGIPALVGMLALAWHAGHGSLGVALVFLPVALLVSLLAFAANELAQRVAAQRHNATTLHHLWPTGVLLGILSIPFGFLYGWQNVTRLRLASNANEAQPTQTARRGRSSEEADLAYEAQAEAAADSTSIGAAGVVTPPVGAGAAMGGAGMFGLSPAARIMFAGMLANLVLGAAFAIVYWFTGWPTMRLGLFASMLVLAFTSVSEPPADGWTLYRRNAPLWAAVFVFAAAVVALLAVGVM